MKVNPSQATQQKFCEADASDVLGDQSLIIVSSRAPVGFSLDEDGNLKVQRSGGGLVTALRGLAQHLDITWIASAVDDLGKKWNAGKIALEEGGREVNLHLVPLEEQVYSDYYNVISNPLLWFLQHSMWDVATSPTITQDTWRAWNQGYAEVNLQFARVIAEHVRKAQNKAIVMLQDYHFYLLPLMLRNILHRPRHGKQPVITHFIHIPWPGAEEFRILPSGMRQAILAGLCAVDLLGFQTREDGVNFLRSVETHLPGAFVNHKHRRIWFHNHATVVRDFPISIDIPLILKSAESAETVQYHQQFEEMVGEKKLILRVDRTDPSKNIVRGFQAFGEMLELHPEHRGKVVFVAILLPSRLDVEEYRLYHDQIMASAGWVNSRYGSAEWEPVRVITGENYSRAIATMQMYDVLLVNSIADGMNLVAKEGPIVNQKDGVLVLSERAGARQQLEPGALIISPCDVYGTAEALHQALTMPVEDKQTLAKRLRWLVEEHDINTWFCDQVNEIGKLNR